MDGDPCDICDSGHYEYGIIGITSYGDGPVEISGYECTACGNRIRLDGEIYDRNTDKPTPKEIRMKNSHIESLNVIHDQNGIETIEVQLFRKSAPLVVKVHPDLDYDNIQEDDHVLITTGVEDKENPYLVARVCNVTDPAPIAEDLSTQYGWAFQLVETYLPQEMKRKEKKLLNALTTAKARADAKVLFDSMPEEVRQLADIKHTPQPAPLSAYDQPTIDPAPMRPGDPADDSHNLG